MGCITSNVILIVTLSPNPFKPPDLPTPSEGELIEGVHIIEN